MEIKMNEIIVPERITFNYEELKQELTEKVSMYETMVYTDDQIKDAKADKASLNKLKKALNDERIRQEREYMKPFNEFKTQVNEIIGIIEQPIAVIDKQVKEYEEKQKQEKIDAIKELWESCDVPKELSLEEVFDKKWLNASTSMKFIKESMDIAIEKFNQDMNMLINLPDFGFEAAQIYIQTLDLNKAISEGQRLAEIQKQKSEAESKKEDAPAIVKDFDGSVYIQDQDKQGWTKIDSPDDGKVLIGFKARLSMEQVELLSQFFNDNHIEYWME